MDLFFFYYFFVCVCIFMQPLPIQGILYCILAQQGLDNFKYILLEKSVLCSADNVHPVQLNHVLLLKVNCQQLFGNMRIKVVSLTGRDS